MRSGITCIILELQNISFKLKERATEDVTQATSIYAYTVNEHWKFMKIESMSYIYWRDKCPFISFVYKGFNAF